MTPQPTRYPHRTPSRSRSMAHGCWGGIRKDPNRTQVRTYSQGVRPAFQFTAPEEKGGLGNLTSLAVGPHRLTSTWVTGNDLPPLRFQPYAPLAPHHALSLKFRKTTRLTTTTRRVFAGWTPKSLVLPTGRGIHLCPGLLSGPATNLSGAAMLKC